MLSGELMHNRTAFIIAHRLSTVRKADMIMVLEHGQIIERGTYDQLFAAGGRCEDFWKNCSSLCFILKSSFLNRDFIAFIHMLQYDKNDKFTK